MATMNIFLPQPLKAWVEQQAQGGRYSNSSDYVRDLIRRDRECTEISPPVRLHRHRSHLTVSRTVPSMALHVRVVHNKAHW